MCEVLPVYDEASPQGRFRKLRQMRLEHLLQGMDYRLGRIDHNTGKVTRLESIETHGKLEWSDYLFFPKETQTASEAGPLAP